VRAIGFIAGALVLLGPAGGTIAYRLEYGNFPLTGGPKYIDWCGRTYVRADDPKPERVDFQERHYVVFREPPIIGKEFESSFTRAEGAARPNGTCGTGIYRREGDGRVVGYSLLGGP
jgi:hypothetical protein